jgi:hypothetical protein
VTALAIGREAALAQRPPDKIGASHLSRTCTAKVRLAKGPYAEDAPGCLGTRWKARYPEAAARLHLDDVLVDSMRGRSTNWTRIRINLRNVPEGEQGAAVPQRHWGRRLAPLRRQSRAAACGSRYETGRPASGRMSFFKR